ncbi:MAG TPA: aminoglycoside phosphotransferase family protein [Bryobacteraceae bacterium]|nr:aminoglycoside phosphotransferase family protein [Bryobacteraceae bacterium]
MNDIRGLASGGMILPKQLIANCGRSSERQAWLDTLPAMLEDLTRRWSLRLGPPFEHSNVTCSWVAPVVCADGTPAVLKLGMPHMEGASEIDGLRFWNGTPTAQLLDADDALGAMLLERCQPGDSLHSEPEHTRDVVIATLLKRLWKRSEGTDLKPFRHLSEMLDFWREETLAQALQWPDAGLVHEGLRLWKVLGEPTPTDVLLATDLHAGNVLRSEREPWLAIDPKPFIGDPTYDVVQHLHVCEERLHADPIGMVKRLADLCEVDAERLQFWTFARAAADPRANWSNPLWIDIARDLAP